MVNRFDLSLSWRWPIVGTIDLGRMTYGLCGGICYAALDHFQQELPLPAAIDLRFGTRWSRYLLKRQMDSFAWLQVPWRVLIWTLRRDADIAFLSLRREWPRARALLIQGQPVVLVVVRSRRCSQLTLNHQVVITAYEEDAAARRVTLWLYDPNYPSQEPTLQFALDDPPSALQGFHSTGEVDRGFFVQRYRSQRRGLPIGSCIR